MGFWCRGERGLGSAASSAAWLRDGCLLRAAGVWATAVCVVATGVVGTPGLLDTSAGLSTFTGVGIPPSGVPIGPVGVVGIYGPIGVIGIVALGLDPFAASRAISPSSSTGACCCVMGPLLGFASLPAGCQQSFSCCG